MKWRCQSKELTQPRGQLGASLSDWLQWWWYVCDIKMIKIKMMKIMRRLCDTKIKGRCWNDNAKQKSWHQRGVNLVPVYQIDCRDDLNAKNLWIFEILFSTFPIFLFCGALDPEICIHHINQQGQFLGILSDILKSWIISCANQTRNFRLVWQVCLSNQALAYSPQNRGPL